VTEGVGGLEGARVDVRTSRGAYTVYVGRGILSGLPGLLGSYVDVHRFALVSDENVGPIHGERLAEACREAGLDVTYLTFPAGEASKTRESWSILTDKMLDAGLGRDSCVIAVGGGVTTDLAGFVAATYLRGVPLVQVPTTYLAMIDASVGGKTGVDVHAGKNLVGAFHAPRAVVADTEVLSTLPRVERMQGLVEAFKHGAILDEEHFGALSSDLPRLLEADPDVSGPAILRSVQLKAEVVGQDEFESGYRQILNFGHTIGHAIEAASGYTLGHGRSVALGMLAEADVGERVGVTEAGTRDRLASVLAELLPSAPPSIRDAAVLQHLGTDKKMRAGRARYVLLRSLGEVDPGEAWTHEVPDGVVREALERVLSEA